MRGWLLRTAIGSLVPPKQLGEVSVGDKCRWFFLGGGGGLLMAACGFVFTAAAAGSGLVTAAAPLALSLRNSLQRPVWVALPMCPPPPPTRPYTRRSPGVGGGALCTVPRGTSCPECCAGGCRPFPFVQRNTSTNDHQRPDMRILSCAVQ